MAKMVVLSCEVCGVIDSVDNRVVTANVCGHRVELCREERVKLLGMVGVSEEHAIAYCDVFDRQAGSKGTNPSLAQVVEMLREAELVANEGQAGAEPAKEALVTAGPTEETGVAEPAVKKRR